MRHTRARRRFKAILTVLLSLCIILFVESRIEAFVPQIKNFAEFKIEETLNGKIKLSIGSIDGGILHPLILNNVSINAKGKNGQLLFSSLDISSIKTNYRIWDALFSTKSFSGNVGQIISRLLAKDSHIFVTFVTKDEKLSGFVRIDGDLERSDVSGRLNFAWAKVDFAGKVRGNSFNLEIIEKSGTVKVDGNIADNGEIVTRIAINHLSLKGVDVVCEAALTNRVVYPPDNPEAGSIEGEFASKSLMLNSRPLPEIRAAYRISGGVLEIKYIDIGELFMLHGDIALKKPYNLDIALTANNVSTSWLLVNFGVLDPQSILTGTMNGKFEFKGPLALPKTSASFEIKKGAISGLEFMSLNASLKGDGPVIRIEESKIVRDSGYFTLAGEMDMRRIGKNSFFEGIKINNDEKALNWDGCSTVRLQDVSELRMKKKINQDFNVDIKKFVSEEKIDESSRYKDEVHLEYNLQSTDRLKMMVGQDTEFFGFEHKDKF